MTEIEPVKRARGCFVYTEHRRYLDLDRLGGRALFGWREKRVMRAYRSVLAVGLSMPYPNYWQRRMERHLKKFFPGFSYALVPTARLPLVQPWFEESLDQDFTLVLPDLGLGSFIYLYRTSTMPPDYHRVSAAGMAALCAAFGAWEHYRRQPLPAWGDWESAGWHRVGPWMWYDGNVESYSALRQRLLSECFLLPSSPQQPLCLPIEHLPAEARRWQRVLAKIQGGVTP